MKIEENEANTVLIGGVDEMNTYTASLLTLAGFIKNENESPFQVLQATTKGVVFGEGATFFVLENQITPSTYAEVLDVAIYNWLEKGEVQAKVLAFLKCNGLELEDIDGVILGFDGDVEFDLFYRELTENCLVTIPQMYYKHLSGEYNTASAFGLWMGAKIIKTQEVPVIVKVNELEKKDYKTILLYNQYKGIDHSFTLIGHAKA